MPLKGSTGLPASILAGLIVAVGLTQTAAPARVSLLAQSPAPGTGAWRQSSYLKAPNPGEGDQFGFAVAVSGDARTLVVGAPGENGGGRGQGADPGDDSADDAGTAYVYVRRGDSWTAQAYLKASNAEPLDQFGNALTLSGDGNTLAVAASFEDSRATGVDGDEADNSMRQSGAVYVFARRGTTWTQQAYLKASNTGEPEDGDTFGYTLALSDDGDSLAVGAPSEDGAGSGVNADQADNAATGAGAVYVFTRRNGAWSQQAYLKADTPAEFSAGDLFGYAVSLEASGDVLAVGAYDESGSSRVVNGPVDNRLRGSGAAYVFRRAGGVWTQEAYLKASTQDANDALGAWVAVSDDGNIVVAGAADEDSLTTGIDAVETGHSGRVGVPDDRSSGAAYAFSRRGEWTQQASFKASNTGTNDWFGIRLALSGDGRTLAVSAPNEDGSARGIDGPDDDAADEAGAVYTFVRDGERWSPDAYIKASNAEQFDEFGSAVALSGDGRTLVVGARFEDGGMSGVGGDEGDNSLIDAGAVYVFTR